MDWLLINPAAGGNRARKMAATVRTRFKDHAIEWQEKTSDTIPEIQDFAARAVQANVERLWVLGGDGSLAAAAAGLCYSPTVLCPLPGGTAGVFCRELDVPGNPAEAVTALLEGGTISVDVGQIWPDGPENIGGTHGADTKFLLMASVGLDAAAVRDVSLTLKRWAGPAAYAAAGLAKFVSWPGASLTVTDDHGIDQIGYHVFVQNTRFYGGPFVLASKAKLDDGRFDVILLKNPSRIALLKFAIAAIRGNVSDLPDVEYFRSASIRVKCFDGLTAVQADGDCITRPPVKITILPKALRVLAPSRKRET